MNRTDLRTFGAEFIKQFQEDDASGMAAELAYRWLFAVFPFGIFLAALGSFVASWVGIDGRDPERAASLFANDGAFELPFLRSLGVGARYTGRREIAGLLRQLLKLYSNFAFAPDDIHVLIETPEKTFAEYVAHARAAATGRTLHHLFTGYLVAEAGEIKLLRETFNPLAMAQAQLPHGAADIPPPGDEVHSF